MTPKQYLKDSMRTNSLAGEPLDRVIAILDHPTFGYVHLTVGDLMLQDAGWGIAGEAGEVADQIKKHYSMNHPWNDEGLKKEVGDVLWYISEICAVKNWTFEDLMQINVDKLAARYGDKFTTEASLNRVA